MPTTLCVHRVVSVKVCPWGRLDDEYPETRVKDIEIKQENGETICLHLFKKVAV
jgi:hypothetical protein